MVLIEVQLKFARPNRLGKVLFLWNSFRSYRRWLCSEVNRLFVGLDHVLGYHIENALLVSKQTGVTLLVVINSSRVNHRGPSSSCEIIILQDKSHGEIMRVCMGIFTTSLSNKKYSQIPNKNTKLQLWDDQISNKTYSQIPNKNTKLQLWNDHLAKYESWRNYRSLYGNIYDCS